MEDVQQFSVINFYRAFQSRIEKIKKFPISTDNLIVHQDLVKMLGDDEVEFAYPFASISMDRPRSFTDLLFTLELYASSFVISIDQQPSQEIAYESLHLSEKSLAAALVDVLIGLANGQILTLTTLIDEDEVQAAEIIYKQKGAKLYSVLRTFAFFTKGSKAIDADYSTEIHKNTFDLPEVKINTTFLGELVLSSMDLSEANRKPFADLSSPLVRKVYDANVDKGATIRSQDSTTKWFPGYKKKDSVVGKLVAYTYYRYIEVMAVVGFMLILLTLDTRVVAVNVLYLLGMLLLTIIGTIYLRQVGRAKWLFGLAAYVSAAIYVVYFLGMNPSGVAPWIIAILVFEPIIEMLVADFVLLAKRMKPKK